jgi:hypothetical protein
MLVLTITCNISQINAQNNEKKEFDSLQRDYQALKKLNYLSQESACSFIEKIEAFQNKFLHNSYSNELLNLRKEVEILKQITQERIKKALEEAIITAADIATKKMAPSEIKFKLKKFHEDKFPKTIFTPDQIDTINEFAKIITQLKTPNLERESVNTAKKDLADLTLKAAQKLNVQLTKETLINLNTMINLYLISEEKQITEDPIEKDLTEIAQEITKLTQIKDTEISKLEFILNEEPLDADKIKLQISKFKNNIDLAFKEASTIYDNLKSLEKKYAQIYSSFATSNLKSMYDNLIMDILELKIKLKKFSEKNEDHNVISQLEKLIDDISTVDTSFKEYRQNPKNINLNNQIVMLLDNIESYIHNIKRELSINNIDQFRTNLEQEFVELQERHRSKYIDKILHQLNELKESIKVSQEELTAEIHHILKYPNINNIKNLNPLYTTMENLEDKLIQLAQKYENYNEIIKEISKKIAVTGFSYDHPEVATQDQKDALLLINNDIKTLQAQYKQYSDLKTDLDSFLHTLRSLDSKLEHYQIEGDEDSKTLIKNHISTLQKLSKLFNDKLQMQLPNIAEITIENLEKIILQHKQETQKPSKLPYIERIIRESINQRS